MLTEGFIQLHTPPKTFTRGQEYFEDGAVLALVRRRHEVWADVQGSYYAPYLVRVRFDSKEVTDVRCDCPQEQGGWCKHIVAALLAIVRQPERIEERPTLMELLLGLDRIQLAQMMGELGDRYPHIMREIETWVTTNKLPTKTDE